jgi:hypothetical protein
MLLLIIRLNKTDYDEATQLITYYPLLEGMNREKAENISFKHVRILRLNIR